MDEHHGDRSDAPFQSFAVWPVISLAMVTGDPDYGDELTKVDTLEDLEAYSEEYGTDAILYGIYGVNTDGMHEWITDRANRLDALTFALRLADGKDVDDQTLVA